MIQLSKIQKVNLLFIFFFMSFFQMISAQNATLKGTVTDTNGEILIAATIKADNKIAVSDANGEYEISLKAGTYQVECSYVSFNTEKKTITLREKTTEILDFKLEEGTNFLNTVTVTSGRFEKPIGEVTVSMDVIKPSFIQSNNSQSIDKVLEKVPGFTIVGGQPNIRGGSGFTYGAGSRVLILVDDIPALQPDAGSPNWSDFQVETIEQIEVLKGAASALYGSSALNGVVNIRTAYAGLKPITQFASYYTSYRNPSDTSQNWWKDKAQPYTAGFTVSHRRKIGKLDLVLGGAWQATKSFNSGTSDTLGRVNIGTRYHVNDRLVIGANTNINVGQSNYFFYWKDGTKGVYEGSPNTYIFNKRKRYSIDPYVSYYGKKGFKHKLLGRFYSVDNQATGGTQATSSLTYGEYQIQKDWGKNFITTVGLVASKTYVKAELYGGNEFNSTNVAPYFQADKKIGKLNISTGFRYESNVIKSPEFIQLAKNVQIFDTIPGGVTKEGKPVFRLGLNYQLAEYTFIRSSFGQGYRFPSIAEKFVRSTFGPTFLIPNVKLTSETGWSSEIAIKQGVKIRQWTGFVDVAAFWTEYQNMMEFVFVKGAAFQSQNVGNTRIKGIEASIAGTGKIGNVNLALLTGYTYIDPKFVDFTKVDKKSISVDYNILKYRNKETLKFDAEATYKKISFGVSANYLRNIDAAFNFIVPGLKKYRADNNKGFTVYDIRAGYEFLKYFKISLLVKNLTNEAYTIRPAIMEAPLNVSARLELKF
jgi:TonB-dependent SusC/RagA subfamily outer membrane receptor